MDSQTTPTEKNRPEDQDTVIRIKTRPILVGQLSQPKE